MSRERRHGMVERGHPRLSIFRQCHILGLAKSTWYHRTKGESAMNLDLMWRIDEQFLETPFYGSHQMRLMAIYQKPRTSQPHPDHKIYPYLLR